jgi:Bacterial toxin 44
VGTYEAFRNHGPMDYKNRYPNSPGVQDFGNFNYGAVTAALGISPDIAMRAAGWGQTRAGTSLPEWGKAWGSAPYGDDPQDQKMISLGIQFTQGQATCSNK